MLSDIRSDITLPNNGFRLPLVFLYVLFYLQQTVSHIPGPETSCRKCIYFSLLPPKIREDLSTGVWEEKSGYMSHIDDSSYRILFAVIRVGNNVYSGSYRQTVQACYRALLDEHSYRVFKSCRHGLDKLNTYRGWERRDGWWGKSSTSANIFPIFFF